MGFFDKIFGKKDKDKVQDEEEITIQPDDLEDFLRKEIDEEGAKIRNSVKPITSDIIKLMDDIKGLVEGLEGAEYSGEVPKRLDKIIKASKPKYIEGIVNAIDEFQSGRIEEMAYKDLEDFYNKVRETAQVIGKIDIHHGRYLPVVFGDTITAVRKSIKRLVDKSSELEKSIRSESIKELNELLRDAGQIKNYINEIKDLEKRDRELKLSDKNLKREIGGIEKGIKELKGGGEFKELKDMKKQLNAVMDKKNEIETEIYNAISPLKRTLRKFKKIAHDGMFNKEVVKAIDLYIENPVETFLTEEDKLYVILNKVRDLIERGELMLKGHEREKVGLRIDALLGGELKIIREQYFAAKKEENSLGEKIKRVKIVKKKRELENSLGEKVKGIRKVEDELHHIKEKKSEIVGDIAGLKKKIESRLSERSKVVRIKGV